MHENKSQRVTRVQRIAHDNITKLREWTVTSFLRNGMECERISQVAKRRGTEIVLVAWEQSQEKGITVRPVCSYRTLAPATTGCQFDLIVRPHRLGRMEVPSGDVSYNCMEESSSNSVLLYHILEWCMYVPQ